MKCNANILSLLAMHVQDFHTPSLCWMLFSTACRMLQALGITGRSISKETADWRRWLFWVLNSLDLSLALIFGRPPVFHRAMRERMPAPSVNQLLGWQPHLNDAESAGGRSSLFGAHFMHHMYAVGNIVADIWNFLYDHPSTHRPIEAIKGSLDSWYNDASKVTLQLNEDDTSAPLTINRFWRLLYSSNNLCSPHKRSGLLTLALLSSPSNIIIIPACCCGHRNDGDRNASGTRARR